MFKKIQNERVYKRRTVCCRAQAKRTNWQNFRITVFFCIFHTSSSISILCQKNWLQKLLQRTFCNQTLYNTNVCRVISHITEVALLNIFWNESAFCLRTAVFPVNVLLVLSNSVSVLYINYELLRLEIQVHNL